jgi:DNA-binding MarR family transcriptional regulator
METIVKLLQEFDELAAENRALKKEIKALQAQTFDNRPKLTEHEVKDIRAAYRGGMMQRDLAEAYAVNPATISRIVRGIYH